MLVTPQALSAIFTGFNTEFKNAFEGAESQWQDIAMQVPSTTQELTYAWLGQSPHLREWLGDRVVKSISAYGYTIINRIFEATLELPRTSIEDDSFGVLKPLVQELGTSAKTHPDELIFSLLAAGATTKCYDGEYFFAPDHVSYDGHGQQIAASNILQPQGPDVAGPSWYLLDMSRPIKPFIWQERVKPEFTALTEPGQEKVFFQDKYTYGVRARGNAGFGLWQMAMMSTAPLQAIYYGTARALMTTLRGDGGRLLGVKGTTLVVPPALEEAGRMLLNAGTINASSNPWVGSAKLIVCPWLS